MPKKIEPQTPEDKQYQEFLKNAETDLTRSVVKGLTDREDVSTVIAPKLLHLKAARGTLIITLTNGTQIKGRFVVDEAVSIE